MLQELDKYASLKNEFLNSTKNNQNFLRSSDLIVFIYTLGDIHHNQAI